MKSTSISFYRFLRLNMYSSLESNKLCLQKSENRVGIKISFLTVYINPVFLKEESKQNAHLQEF